MNVITIPATHSLPAGAIITLEPHEQFTHPQHPRVTVTTITITSAGSPTGAITFQGHLTSDPETPVDLTASPATRGRISITEFLHLPPQEQATLIPNGQVRGVTTAAASTTAPHASRALPPVTSLQEFTARRTNTRARSTR